MIQLRRIVSILVWCCKSIGRQSEDGDNWKNFCLTCVVFVDHVNKEDSRLMRLRHFVDCCVVV